MKKENVISEDVAVEELEKFIGEWVENPVEKSKLKSHYPLMFDALLSGNLILEDNKPIYKMVRPFKDVKGVVAISELTFRTRISPLTGADLAKGLDLEKDELNYAINCLCYIINQPKTVLDDFRQKDYSTAREIASLFMNAG